MRDNAMMISFIFLIICSGPLMVMGQTIPGDSSHYGSGDIFINPYVDEGNEPGFLQILKWFWERKSPDTDDSTIAVTVSRETPNLTQVFNPNDSLLQVTWIGHSTFLVQLDGVNFLTDPIFSERSSPIKWIGPKRMTPPAIPIDALPPVDFVLISHNHYDHLDLPTVHALGNNSKWFVPLGVKIFLESEGITNVEELDWWSQVTIGRLKIFCTPNQHFSGRTPFDRNECLWASWAIISPNQRVWFAGDTGYNSFQFKEIGGKFGPFDLALIPIGAYDPEWIMRDHHVNPFEAVGVHTDVRSKFSIGMHWGTFTLTDEPIGEPPRLLKEAVRVAALDSASFVTVPQGRTILIR